MELQAGALKLEFEKIGDRFGHKLLFDCGSKWSVVLESIEGTDQERWPASPPLQQIVAEPIGKDGRTVLLGVGLSGTGHWSISVDENDVGGLVSDIACRVSGDHGFLGSSWRLEKSWRQIRSEDHGDGKRIVVCNDEQKIFLELLALHGDIEITAAQESVLGGEIAGAMSTQIRSKPTGRDRYPKPHRWAVQCRLLVNS